MSTHSESSLHRSGRWLDRRIERKGLRPRDAAYMIGSFRGLSLISVVTAAITSGFVSRAEAPQRAAGEDPVMQKLDQLSLELRAVNAELEQLRSGTNPDDATRPPSRPRP